MCDATALHDIDNYNDLIVAFDDDDLLDLIDRAIDYYVEHDDYLRYDDP